jgi:hypothetical protein
MLCAAFSSFVAVQEGRVTQEAAGTNFPADPCGGAGDLQQGVYARLALAGRSRGCKSQSGGRVDVSWDKNGESVALLSIPFLRALCCSTSPVPVTSMMRSLSPGQPRPRAAGANAARAGGSPPPPYCRRHPPAPAGGTPALCGCRRGRECRWSAHRCRRAYPNAGRSLPIRDLHVDMLYHGDLRHPHYFPSYLRHSSFTRLGHLCPFPPYGMRPSLPAVYYNWPAQA